MNSTKARTVPLQEWAASEQTLRRQAKNSGLGHQWGDLTGYDIRSSQNFEAFGTNLLFAFGNWWEFLNDTHFKQRFLNPSWLPVIDSYTILKPALIFGGLSWIHGAMSRFLFLNESWAKVSCKKKIQMAYKQKNVVNVSLSKQGFQGTLVWLIAMHAWCFDMLQAWIRPKTEQAHFEGVNQLLHLEMILEICWILPGNDFGMYISRPISHELHSMAPARMATQLKNSAVIGI